MNHSGRTGARPRSEAGFGMTGHPNPFQVLQPVYRPYPTTP